MSDLTDRLNQHWTDWGAPTNRDTCVNEECMALDCKLAMNHICALNERIAALEAALDWSLDGADIVSEIVPASIREEIFNSGIRRIVRHEPSPEPPCTLETKDDVVICHASLKGRAGDPCPVCGSGPCVHLKTKGVE